MKLTTNQLKQIIKEELQDVTVEPKLDEQVATVLESIDWVIEYHKRRLQWHWTNYGPNSHIANGDASFIINQWKENFNNPNNRNIDLRTISEKLNFFDEWLSNKPLRQKLIDAIFKTTKWQDFHNESLKMIEVIDAASKGKLNLGRELDEMIVSGMKNNDLLIVRIAVTLAVDLGLL
jgi:hypothetical protein